MLLPSPKSTLVRRHSRLERYMQALLRVYADMRVGATHKEKFAYRTSETVMLTFDDYGSPEQINTLLNTLARENVQAMFFLQGDWARTYPHLVDTIASAGHIIGNHTYSHPDMLALSEAEIRAEILGGPSSHLLRPPRGRYNSRIRRIAADLGMKIIYWSIDSNDWQGVSEQYIHDKVLDELHPGAVILFHLHADNSINVMSKLIREARARGYDFPQLEASK